MYKIIIVCGKQPKTEKLQTKETKTNVITCKQNAKWKVRDGDQHETYQQKLSDLSAAELFVFVCGTPTIKKSSPN